MKKILFIQILLCATTALYAVTGTIDRRVIVNANGGVNPTGIGYFLADQGGVVMIPNPTRAGFTFAGWESTDEADKCLMQSVLAGKALDEEVVFDGTSTYFSLGREHMYEDALTLNIWAYMDNWGEYATKNMRLVSCTDTDGGYCISASSTDVTTAKIKYVLYDKGTKWVTTYSDILWSDLAAGWHMFTLTFNGSNMKGYVDGKLVTVSKPFASGLFGYHTTNSILIGADPTLNDKPDANSPCYFAGKMSNVSLSNAALSPTGVKTLYAKGRISCKGTTPFIMPTTARSLTATWTENATTTLTLDAAEGLNTMEQDMYEQAIGTSLAVTNPTRSGYAFKHWDINTSHYISNYQGLPCSSPEAVEFDGTTTYYNIGRERMHADCFTINVWAYMDNWADFTAGGGMRIYSCTQSGGFGLEKYNNETFINFSAYDSEKDGGGGYNGAGSSLLWSDLTAGWHMFTQVFDGNKVYGYVDGQLVATSAEFAGQVGYSKTNDILIGAEAGVGSEPDGKYFRGKIKNFAIMHTAIPAAEVVALYAAPTVARYYFPAQDHTLTATWEYASSTVNLDAAGGTNIDQDSYTQEYHTAVTIYNPTRSGFTFTNWDAATSQYISNYQGIPCSSDEEVVFDGVDDYYDLGHSLRYGDCFTINVWASMEDWSEYATKNLRLFSDMESVGINIESDENDRVRFAGFHELGWIGTAADVLWSDLASGWHMFTFVFDGTRILGYIDGELKANNGNVREKGKMAYNDNITFLLGAEPNLNSSNKQTVTCFFHGMMKNFAVIHAAIPAEEVALIYNMQPGAARYYFPTTDVTMTAQWKESPTMTDVENATAWRYYIADKTLYVEGVEVNTIQLFSPVGKILQQATHTNILKIESYNGSLILRITDTSGNVYTKPIVVY